MQAAAETFNGKMAATNSELEALWVRWDTALDAGDSAAQSSAKEAMVALLNKRSYLRNLVRDVTAALEPTA